jgi:hypothetical protein
MGLFYPFRWRKLLSFLARFKLDSSTDTIPEILPFLEAIMISIDFPKDQDF